MNTISAEKHIDEVYWESKNVAEKVKQGVQNKQEKAND